MIFGYEVGLIRIRNNFQRILTAGDKIHGWSTNVPLSQVLRYQQGCDKVFNRAESILIQVISSDTDFSDSRMTASGSRRAQTG